MTFRVFGSVGERASVLERASARALWPQHSSLLPVRKSRLGGEEGYGKVWV